MLAPGANPVNAVRLGDIYRKKQGLNNVRTDTFPTLA
jgi:hypothetical protein